MKRSSMTAAARASLAVPPLVAVAGLVGYGLLMGGSIIGFFLVALLPLLLLVAFPPLIFGMMGRYGQTTWRRAAFGGASVVSLAMMAFVAITTFPSIFPDPPRFLPKSKEGKSATRLEFRFPNVTRAVSDPHGQVRFYRGEAPEVVSQPDGSTALVFHGVRTVLWTWSDSASVNERGFNIGSLMGADTSDKELRVTEAGSFAVIREIRRLDPEPR